VCVCVLVVDLPDSLVGKERAVCAEEVWCPCSVVESVGAGTHVGDPRAHSDGACECV